MIAQAQTNEMTLADHLKELRSRIMWVVIAVGIGAGSAYSVRDRLQDFITRPLNQDLYYTSPVGGFDFIFQICLLVGIIVAVPVIAYHLLRFIEPLLQKKHRHYIVKRLSLAVLLFACGATFAYMVALPATLYFLNNFTSEGIQPLITTSEYLSFVMIYLLVFGLIFQLPLFISVTNDITPLNPKAITSKRRHVLVGSFVVAAIASPTPDPLNQTIMALPIILLLEVSIVMLKISYRKKDRQLRRAVQPVPKVSTPVPAYKAPAASKPVPTIAGIRPRTKQVFSDIKPVRVSPNVQRPRPFVGVVDRPVVRHPQPARAVLNGYQPNRRIVQDIIPVQQRAS